MDNTITIGNVQIKRNGGLFLIAGPCVIESLAGCLDIAGRLAEIGEKTGVGVIFKASFDKANRSSASSFRGPGLAEGLEILAQVRAKTGLGVMTDVHESDQPRQAGAVVDCLQIPAFLCRQTDLLVACAETGKPVSVKKGQFLSPGEMSNVVDKIRDAGNDRIILTERGTFFGYGRLVNDFPGVADMMELGWPVCFDVTHSTQKPGEAEWGKATGGRPQSAPVLARCAVAAGVHALFFETHPDPAQAMCDAATMLPLDSMPSLLAGLARLHAAVAAQR